MIWLLLGCADPPPPPPVAESTETVIVVVGCTLRADRTSVYGNPRQTTPYLQELADQGVVFEDMVSNAPWTRPAIASLISGLYPGRLGIDDERGELNTNRGLHPDVVTLAERFSEAGWSTVGATANPNANAYFQMDQGFAQYHEASGLWREGYAKVDGETLVRDWAKLASQVEGPLYGQLVVVDTHKPLGRGTRHPAGWGLRVFLSPSGVDRYDAALGLFDEVLRGLDAALAEMGRSDRLLVVVGDHGEGLSDPDWAGHAHGRYLYDANLRVPWVMHGGGVQPGTRVDGLVESIDLHPTLLELAGLPDPGVDGRSLAAQARGESEQSGKELGFSETFFASDHRMRASTPEWVYIRNDQGARDRGEHELYAAADRQQSENLALLEPGVVEALSGRVETLAQGVHSERLVLDLDEDLDDELRGRLEALGYIEDPALPEGKPPPPELRPDPGALRPPEAPPAP